MTVFRLDWTQSLWCNTESKCSEQSVVQTRASQQSITVNFWALIIHIYHIMVTVTGGFSRISFLLFPKCFLSNLELVFLEFKHFYKTHRTSLFSFYLFIYLLLFDNHSGYVRSPLSLFFPITVGTKEKLKSFNLTSSTFCCKI